MNFNISFINDHFEVELSGKASVDDCRSYFNHLIAHENWKPDSLVLSDETKLKTDHLTVDEVKEMAVICSSHKEIIGETRFAAHVENKVAYGMNRMFQGYTDFKWDAVIEAFEDKAEALRWLLNS